MGEDTQTRDERENRKEKKKCPPSPPFSTNVSSSSSSSSLELDSLFSGNFKWGGGEEEDKEEIP